MTTNLTPAEQLATLLAMVTDTTHADEASDEAES